MNATVEIIKEIIKKYNKEETLQDVDSLTFVRFIVEIENFFDIEFDDDRLSIYSFQSDGDLIEYIIGKIKEE